MASELQEWSSRSLRNDRRREHRRLIQKNAERGVSAALLAEHFMNPDSTVCREMSSWTAMPVHIFKQPTRHRFAIPRPVALGAMGILRFAPAVVLRTKHSLQR